MSAVVTNSEMHAVLKSLGFTSQEETGIIEDQGSDNLEELKVLDDKVKSLRKVVMNPGGATGTGGTVVFLRAESNLKLIVFYLKYLDSTSRLADATNITL